MKKLTLLILLIPKFALSMTLSELIDSIYSNMPKYEQDAIYQIKDIQYGLALHLIENDAFDIKTYGYQYLSSFIDGYFTPTNFNDNWSKISIGKEIDLLVGSGELSPIGLSIALTVCSKYLKDKSIYVCDFDDLLLKQEETSPKNAYIYLYPIQRAVFENNNTKLSQLISKMARTSYFDSYNYKRTKLYQITHNYLENILIPSELLIYYKDNKNNISDASKIDLSLDSEEHQLLKLKMSIQLDIEQPEFSALIDTCKTKLKYHKMCLTIANILIQNKNISPVLRGYSIKSTVYKNNGNQEKFLSSEKALQYYWNQYKCLTTIIRSAKNEENNYDVELLEHLSKTKRIRDEFDYLLKSAELLYQNENRLGNPEFMNPNECLIKSN